MIVSREVAATTPPSRPPRSWNGAGEVLGVVPLLRAEGSEEEAQVGLVLPEDVRPSEAETMILGLLPIATLGPRRRHPTGYVRASLGRSCND